MKAINDFITIYRQVYTAAQQVSNNQLLILIAAKAPKPAYLQQG